MYFSIRTLINTIILFFAFFFFAAGIKQAFEAFYDFKDLIKNEGVLERKNIYFERRKKNDMINVIKLTFTNGKDFIASRYSERLDYLILKGDSLCIYTKKVSSFFGNMITDGKGSTWSTKKENEVFHLLSNRYEGPLIDFEENKKQLLKYVWGYPLGGVIFLA